MPVSYDQNVAIEANNGIKFIAFPMKWQRPTNEFHISTKQYEQIFSHFSTNSGSHPINITITINLFDSFGRDCGVIHRTNVRITLLHFVSVSRYFQHLSDLAATTWVTWTLMLSNRWNRSSKNMWIQREGSQKVEIIQLNAILTAHFLIRLIERQEHFYNFFMQMSIIQLDWSSRKKKGIPKQNRQSDWTEKET